MTMITRFAPSPTGFLHIGNARTALFSWLYARHVGGKFLLRIEDTDLERSTQEAVQVIFEGLRWLGIDWDGEPFFQRQAVMRHQAVALKLLKSGHAYRCYATPEELDALRRHARAIGQPPVYPGRDASDAGSDVTRPHVIRLRVPQIGQTIVEDLIQGSVQFDNQHLDDMVLLRSDGSATFLLACAVDDYDMGVTHVIRGDDHLINAARQTHIYKAMGWDIPLYAHMPLIHGADGVKLSKRHGAVGTDWYHQEGYLPQALCNGLARLGWGHGNEEIFTMAQAIEWFDVRDVGRAPARIDFDRMAHINSVHLRSLSEDDLWQAFSHWCQDVKGHTFSEDQKQKICIILPLYNARVQTLSELFTAMRFLYVPDWQAVYDEKTHQLLQQLENRQRLQAISETLKTVTDWCSAVLETVLKEFMQQHNLKMRDLYPLLRACLTGTTNAPTLPPIMEALGMEKSLERIQNVLTA